MRAQFSLPPSLTAIAQLEPKEYPREILAGVTLAALTVPLNVGYAQIAGLPASVGLYAAMVPILGYAAFTTSRHVVASPDAAIAALLASALFGMAQVGSSHYVELALVLSLICAAVFALLAAFRLAFLADFLSRAVLVGFLSGMGVEVLFSQVEKILGYKVEAPGFFREAIVLVRSLPKMNVWSVAVGVGAVLIVMAVRRFAPAWPGALVALVITTAGVAAFHLDQHGVKVLGEVSAGLPSLAWPHASLEEWAHLVPVAVAIVGVTVAEGLLLGRSMARRHSESVDDDAELLAYAGANALAGLFGALPIGASASRTATVEAAGSTTQLPALVAAAIVAVTVVLFKGVLAVLPQPALAGVVAVAVIGLIDFRQLRYLSRVRRSEFGIALVCMVCVLAFGPLAAVFIAFALSTVDVVRRLSHPETAVLLPSADGSTYVRTEESLPPREAAPGVIVYRFGAPLQFSNTKAFFSEVERIVSEDTSCAVLVLDMQAVSDIDSTGAETFEQVVTWLDARGVRLALSRVSARVVDELSTYGLSQCLDQGLVFETNRAAVESLASSALCA